MQRHVCVCTCVCVYYVCKCPEISISHLPLLLSTLFCDIEFLSDLPLSYQLPRQADHQALRIFLFCLHAPLANSVRHAHISSFYVVLGIRTRAFSASTFLTESFLQLLRSTESWVLLLLYLLSLTSVGCLLPWATNLDNPFQ